MRTYSIFLMEPDVATDYFGKEHLLLTLFQEYNRTSTESQEIVTKQVNYITRNIPLFHMQQYIQKYLSYHKGFEVTRNGLEIHCSSMGGQSTAILKISHNKIELVSRGNFEAETTFFEVLRKFDPCFLAVDYSSKRCGWLNPIKQRSYI